MTCALLVVGILLLLLSSSSSSELGGHFLGGYAFLLPSCLAVVMALASSLTYVVANDDPYSVVCLIFFSKKTHFDMCN